MVTAPPAGGPDPSVADFAELRPRLAEGLVFRPHGPAAGDGVRVENPADRRFHDLGRAEYAVLSQFDGTASVAEAVSLAARMLRDDALSVDEVAELCEWAAGAKLLRLRGEEAKPSAARAIAAANPLWMTVPLPSPERAVDALAPALAWTQSPRMLAALLPLAAAAAASYGMHAGEIAAALGGLLAATNWLPLAAALALLKLWHELGHALACRRYGVEIPKSGVILILLAPCPFVDATASWRLHSPWRRIHIAAAGMLAELLVAAAVLLAWPWVGDPAARQFAANLLVASTVTTLLFNANPLMRFDGYFILSDLAGCQNLATRGAASASSRLVRLLTGRRPRTTEPAAVEAYGWAAAAWRVVVTATLAAGAEAIWPGFGLAVGLFGAAATLLPPAARLAMQVKAAAPHPAAALRAVAAAGLAAAVLAAIGLAPWPLGVSVPGVVRLPEEARVVAAAGGFVDAVFVSAGEPVAAGQEVARLRDDDLARERRGLAARLRGSAAAERSKAAGDAYVEAQIELDRRTGLRRRRTLLDGRVADLSVRAAAAGTLAGLRPGDRLGTLAAEGEEMAYVVPDGPAEVRAWVPDALVDHFRGREGRPVNVDLPDGSTAAGTFVRLDPTADRRGVDPSLTAAAGGPVAVAAGGDDVRAAVPHFPITVRMDRPLPPGLRAYVSIDSRRGVAAHLWTAARDWWRSLLP